MTEQKLPVEIGEVLAGKYRVERVIGQGGMGVVLAARHTQLGQRVAIKFLTREATPETVARFLREARALVRLRTEHVARVIDVGELPSKAPYIVMEYLGGNDLHVELRRRGESLPVAEAVHYLLQACEAVAEAHATGIVHRDLKPSNLFLTTTADGSPCVKVLDFGISKISREEDDPDASADQMSLTQTTAVMGSPNYMAPEQMRSTRDVDARADIWSLGAILYQLLTSSVPFKAATFPELVLKVANEDAPPPSQRRAGLPQGLQDAILRCLMKDPAQRFQSVAELAAAIAPFGAADAALLAERVARVQGASLPPPSSPGAAAAVVTKPSPGASQAEIEAKLSAVASSPSLVGVVSARQKGDSSTPGDGSSPSTPAPGDTRGGSTLPSAGEPARRSRREAALIGIAIGAVVAAGAVVVSTLRKDAAVVEPAASSTIAPPPSAPTSTEPPVAASAPLPGPAPSATAVASSASAQATSSASATPPRPGPARPSAPPTAATAAPTLEPKKNPLDMQIK